jgi:hypothetical protein
MGEMALVVLGLFVLVWIISAVVKASQDPGGKRGGPPQAGRQRPAPDATPQRTSNSDIDRFMAEIDRLRRRGDGAAAGRPVEQRPAPPPIIERRPQSQPEPRPRSLERRERDRERERDRAKEKERRPRQTSPRPAAPPAPPPLPSSETVPVLRPVAPDRPAPPAAPPSTPAIPPKPARPARPAATAVAASGPVSPVLQTLQSVLNSKQGPAAALILAEIFGPPKGMRMGRPDRLV